jgi:hypothetical protein
VRIDCNRVRLAGLPIVARSRFGSAKWNKFSRSVDVHLRASLRWTTFAWLANRRLTLPLGKRERRLAASCLNAVGGPTRTKSGQARKRRATHATTKPSPSRHQPTTTPNRNVLR